MEISIWRSVSPGDSVIVNEIMASDVYRTIELAGGKLITVPSDEHGMITDNLDKVIEASNPKFIYVDSSFNNPRGSVMTLERRRKILELSYHRENREQVIREACRLRKEGRQVRTRLITEKEDSR